MGETTRHAVILDTPEEIDWFRFMLGYRALHLEANTGIKMTRRFSAVKFFNGYGFKSKRLKPLLEEVATFLQNNTGSMPPHVLDAVKNTMR